MKTKSTVSRVAAAALALALAAALAPQSSAPAAAQTGDTPSVTNVRVRATPPGAPVTAAYFQVSTKANDRLLAVKIDPEIAGPVEIHDMIEDAGIMKMRRVEVVDIKPGSPTELKPGGKHLMLMNLKRTLAEGETVKLVLVFEKAGEMTVDAKVEKIVPASAKDAPAAGHKHH